MPGEISKQYDWRKTDLETGETKRWTGEPGIRSDPITKEPFVMMRQNACETIATNYSLQGIDFRVFFHLLSILDNENWIDVHHGRVARQISTPEHNISRPRVSKALKSLVDAGMIAKGEERTYRLMPGIGWKGDMAAQAKAEKQVVKGNLSLVRPGVNE